MWFSTLPSLLEARPAPPRLEFDAVYRQHAPAVWRALRGLGVREPDLEDACQEVFVVVLRKLEGFDPRHPITTWLYAICLRVASGWRRKAHRRREVVTDAPPERGAAAGPDAALERTRAATTLQHILDALDDDKRAVFVLFELAELPMNEVAATLNVPLKTAYSRLYAAREHVERRLAALEDRRP